MEWNSGFSRPNVVWNKTIYIFIPPVSSSTFSFSISSSPLPKFSPADFSIQLSSIPPTAIVPSSSYSLFRYPFWRYSSIHHWTRSFKLYFYVHTKDIVIAHHKLYKRNSPNNNINSFLGNASTSACEVKAALMRLPSEWLFARFPTFTLNSSFNDITYFLIQAITKLTVEKNLLFSPLPPSPTPVPRH